jgi:hypothetical protein
MSTDAPTPGTLALAEYERRKAFLENLKSLTKTEHIEIIRILQKHSAEFSENLNGVFFNCCNLTQQVFDDLELFIQFTQTNRKNLADREMYLSSLTRTAGLVPADGSK